MNNSNDHTSETPGRDKRLSIDHCRKALNKNGKAYTDEQVKQIRDLLYTLAHIQKHAAEQKRNEASS